MLLKGEGCRFAGGLGGRRIKSQPVHSQGYGIHRGVIGLPGRTRLATVQCSASENPEHDGVGGDLRVQQQLVEMIQMQVTKVNLSEYLDKRSEHLRTIAHDFRSDHARIALQAMIGIDEAGNRVLRELDAGASAIEKELKLARADIEAQSEQGIRLHAWSVQARNERLFFKGLYSEPEETQSTKSKISTVVPPEAGDSNAGYKQFLSGSIAVVLTSLVYSSGSAFVTGTMMKPWKIASYCTILTMLLAQLAYVDALLGESKAQTLQGKDESLKNKNK